MPSERILFAVAITGVLLIAATINLVMSWRWWRHHRVDRSARGIRGFNSAVGFFAGAVALAAGSSSLRGAWPWSIDVLRFVTTSGIVAFCICLIFSAVSWRLVK